MNGCFIDVRVDVGLVALQPPRDDGTDRAQHDEEGEPSCVPDLSEDVGVVAQCREDDERLAAERDRIAVVGELF